MAKGKNIICKNWPRYIFQWGILIAIVLFISGIVKSDTPSDPETYCPMGGLQAFATYAVRGSLPCSMSSVQILMGFALVLAVVLFSKLFCSYVCPIGTVEDLLIKLRNGLHVKSIKIKNQTVIDKILRIFKYALLFWIFYSTMTASELFCKNLDPYYAVATGFKGEITKWMSYTTLALVVLGGVAVDNFWCRYICPLGAASNTFKFWVWVLALYAIYYLLNLAGISVPWWILLGGFCLMGYLLEILCSKPKFQLLYIQKKASRCNRCGACEKQCPYHIPIREFGKRINSVDCTLCGECVAVCGQDALQVGVTPNKGPNFFNRILPALLVAAIGLSAFYVGKKYELPTINEQWGIYSNDSLHTQIVDPSTLESCTLEGLKQVHCFGSSMAFKGKLEKIAGVHGVKTYVKTHKATILYDPSKTSPEKIQQEIYVPSSFKANTPDYLKTPELRVITIRTEHMPSATDVNLLGIQFKQLDSLIYGLESEWDCPLVVRMFVDPAFDKDEEWIRDVVNKPTLDILTASGEIKSTPLGFEFVRMEPKDTVIATTEFLERMFKPFTAEFSSRIEAAKNQKQFVYEIADEAWTKPLMARQLPFVSNHLSANEGIIGIYTRLNKDYVPSLQIRYAWPMTADKIWTLLTMPEWTITYAPDDIRTVPAKVEFKKPGISYPYVGSMGPTNK